MKSSQDQSKKIRQGISLSAKSLANGKAKSNGNFSAYVEKLIERDRLNAPIVHNPLSPSILIEITRTLCGELDAQVMSQLLKESPQPKALRNILTSIIHGEIASEILHR